MSDQKTKTAVEWARDIAVLVVGGVATAVAVTYKDLPSQVAVHTAQIADTRADLDDIKVTVHQIADTLNRRPR